MCCCYVPLTNSRVPATRRLTRDTIERFHPPAAQRNTIQPPGTFVSDRTTNQCFVIRDQSYQHKIYNASRWFCLILLCDIWVMMATIIAALWPSAPWRQCLVLITFSCFVLLEQSFLDKNTQPNLKALQSQTRALCETREMPPPDTTKINILSSTATEIRNGGAAYFCPVVRDGVLNLFQF